MVHCSCGPMIETLVQNAILEHISTAAAWRSRYLEEQYSAFDQVALRHEEIARRLGAEWDALQTELKSIETMKRAVN